MDSTTTYRPSSHCGTTFGQGIASWLLTPPDMGSEGTVNFLQGFSMNASTIALLKDVHFVCGHLGS